jgi:proteasome lid subunit RPN8/RPN11
MDFSKIPGGILKDIYGFLKKYSLQRHSFFAKPGFLKEHRERIEEKHGESNRFNSRADKFPLEQIYISQTMSIPFILPGSIPPELPAGEKEIIDANDILGYNRFIVLGDAGIGKTTLLKHLALQPAKKNPRKKIFNIFICLREYLENESEKSLVEYILGLFDDYETSRASEIIESELKKGRCLLLLDNLQAIPKRKRVRDDIIDELFHMIEQFRENQFIITSKTSGFDTDLQKKFSECDFKFGELLEVEKKEELEKKEDMKIIPDAISAKNFTEPQAENFPHDIGINFIGTAEPIVTLDAKLSPVHDPEYNTSRIDDKKKSSGMDIFIKKSVYQDIDAHAESDTRREVGGVLLGGYYHCDNSSTTFIEIQGSIAARHTDSGSAHLTFTHETWNEINRIKDEKYPDLNIVGWYHTHPSMGIFLSGHDTFIQTQFFNEEWHVAYVVDPVYHKRGFFQLRDERVVKCDGFYLYSLVSQLPIKQKIEKIMTDVVESQSTKQIISQVKHRWSFKDSIIVVLSVIAAFLIAWNIQSSSKSKMSMEMLRQQIDSISAKPVTAPMPVVIYKYNVQEGETLPAICLEHYGDGSDLMCERVAEYNQIPQDKRVEAGQIILLPPKEMLFN